jgi:biopolymer transport protein ExbD
MDTLRTAGYLKIAFVGLEGPPVMPGAPGAAAPAAPVAPAAPSSTPAPSTTP